MQQTKQLSAKVLFAKLKKHLEAAQAIRRELAGPPSHMLMEDTYTALDALNECLQQADNCVKAAYKSEGMPFKQKLSV